MSNSRPVHALSFDVEEYFHVANLKGQFPMEAWDKVQSRLDVGMQTVLDALSRHGASATFFFLGWVAERRPDWVARVHEQGHEVASHGYDHRFLQDVGPDGIQDHLQRAEDAITAAGVPKPRGFRASTFTVTRSTMWALDALVDRGYLYDSSIHPVLHPTYGIPDFDPAISRVQRASGSLLEFPVATYPFMGRNLPVGGGGYFRLLPGALHRALMRSLERRGRCNALYFHPWEFDPDQPRVKTSALKGFRHYLNLKKSLPRLESLLQSFRFVSMQEALRVSGHLTELH